MNFSASLLAKLSALGAGLLPPALPASPFYSTPSWGASQFLPSPPFASPNNRAHSGVASAKRKARKAKRQRQAKRMQARSSRSSRPARNA